MPTASRSSKTLSNTGKIEQHLIINHLTYWNFKYFYLPSTNKLREIKKKKMQVETVKRLLMWLIRSMKVIAISEKACIFLQWNFPSFTHLPPKKAFPPPPLPPKKIEELKQFLSLNLWYFMPYHWHWLLFYFQLNTYHSFDQSSVNSVNFFILWFFNTRKIGYNECREFVLFFMPNNLKLFRSINLQCNWSGGKDIHL